MINVNIIEPVACIIYSAGRLSSSPSDKNMQWIHLPWLKLPESPSLEVPRVSINTMGHISFCLILKKSNPWPLGFQILSVLKFYLTDCLFQRFPILTNEVARKLISVEKWFIKIFLIRSTFLILKWHHSNFQSIIFKFGPLRIMKILKAL